MMIVTTTVYSINDDGQETKIGDNVGFSALIQGHVFIAIDNNAKKIYIWKGHESPVRQKFISARTASKIRQSYGMVYKVESIDQGEEPPDFIALMGEGTQTTQPSLAASSNISNIPTTPIQPVITPAAPAVTSTVSPVASARPANGLIASVRPANIPSSSTQTTGIPIASARPANGLINSMRPVNIPSSSTQTTDTPVASIPSPSISSSSNASSMSMSASTTTPSVTPIQVSSIPAETATTVKTTATMSTSPTITKSTAEKEIQVTATEDVSPDLLNIVIDKLRELDEPEGMQREIVLIKNRVFSCTKDFHKLFKKEILRLDPMDDLPSGAFPASDYYTRLFIDDAGKVLFIELFAEIPRTERDEFLSEVRASLRDLTKLGI